MTIKVYVNSEGKVISEKDFLTKIEKVAQDCDETEVAFEKFLDDNYDKVELFKMTYKDKEIVRKNFHEENYNYAEEEMENEWTENILEI